MVDSFNYISFGNWENVRGGIDELTIGRGRMFEYTPSDIENRLRDLDGTAANYLEKLPTFLCSELAGSDNGVSMLIKYGRVSEIAATPRTVSAKFTTLIDFGEVEFEDLEEARAIFDADRFQLYRTHWAVREGDDQAVIERLVAAKPGLVGQPDAAAAPIDDGVIEPPPRNKNILGTADSVEQFLELLYTSPAIAGTETFFRGHSDARYELTPSLLRKWSNGDWQFMPNEDRLCQELLIAHHDEFQADELCFDRLVRMQHYGLPTRLLDISGNPLVALFFACSCKPDQLAVDGEVVIFRVPSAGVKYYNSDTVSCLANLCKLTFSQKNDLDLSLEETAFNATPVAEKLLHHIKSEKRLF